MVTLMVVERLTDGRSNEDDKDCRDANTQTTIVLVATVATRRFILWGRKQFFPA